MKKMINELLPSYFYRRAIKNCSYFLLLNGLLIVTSCSNKLPTDSLLVPPNFDVVPTNNAIVEKIDSKKVEIEKDNKDVKKSNKESKGNQENENNKSIQDLKGLLLD